MKIILLFLALLVIFSTVSAQNLDVKLYQEVSDAKDYGNIRAKPGETITSFIEIENDNADRKERSQEIEDILIKVTLEDLAGTDIEEEYDDFDLKATKDETLTFRFTIPERIREGSYTLLIEYEGTEDDVDFSDSVDYSLIVEKKKHDLMVRDSKFTPSKVSCNEVSTLNFEIINLGTSNEVFDLEIKNKFLEHSTLRKVTLDAYPGDDIYKVSVPIKIPADIPSSTYDFDINFQYENNIVSEKVPIDVSCIDMPAEDVKKIIEKEQPENKIVPITAEPAGSTTGSKATIIVEQKNSFPIIVLVGLIVLVILAILIITGLKKK